MQIINALNGLLNNLFFYSKEKYFIIFIIHFIEKKAIYNDSFKKHYKVFDKLVNFFDYFEIPSTDRYILFQIIPSQYFTDIDNFSFKQNIKDIFNNITKEYQ